MQACKGHLAKFLFHYGQAIRRDNNHMQECVMVYVVVPPTPKKPPHFSSELYGSGMDL